MGSVQTEWEGSRRECRCGSRHVSAGEEQVSSQISKDGEKPPWRSRGQGYGGSSLDRRR